MRNLAPIALFIIIQTVYDNFGKLTTHWAIFFNVGLYITIAWFSFILSKNEIKKNRLPFYTILAGFALLALISLSKWRLSWDEYLRSMGNLESFIPFFILLLTGFTAWIIWKK
jgi:hypothetical protein